MVCNRLQKYSFAFISNNLSSPDLGKRFLSSLLWDYQSIAARDPQLPVQLLPPKWSQKNALDFIARVKKTFKIMD